MTRDVSEKNRPIDPRSKWQRDGGCLVPDVISVADRESSIYDFRLVSGENRRHEERSFIHVLFLSSHFPLFFPLFCDTVIQRHSLPRFPDVQFSSWTIFLDRGGWPRSFFFHATLTSLLHAFLYVFHSLFHDTLNY